MMYLNHVVYFNPSSKMKYKDYDMVTLDLNEQGFFMRYEVKQLL